MAVASQPDLVGLTDRNLIAVARDEGRALVTENVGDLVPIVTELARVGRSYAGIILTNRHRFPRSRDGVGRLVEAQGRLLAANLRDDAFTDRVVWLESVDGS